MNLSSLANIVTACFCLAVLVQSVRMMRALKAMKEGGLSEVVEALDRSTAQARGVLSELKATLGECARSERGLRDGRELADELGVMIGIANASAERLMEAADVANRKPAETWNVMSGYFDVDADDAAQVAA